MTLTEKEYARYLFDMFMQNSISDDQVDYCKQCATIVVNELIKYDESCGGMSGYLIGVKEEIQKI